MSPTRLVLLAHAAGAPSLSLVIDDGRVVERRALEPDPLDPPEPMRTVLIVPGAEALARWLDIPAKTEAQAGPAAAYMLEDQLATPRERLHLTLGPLESDGLRLVVVVDRAVMEGWTDRALALGVFPDVVLPDHLTLPVEEDGTALAVRFGDTLAIRGERLALSGEPDLVPLLLGERPHREIEDSAAIEALLVAAALDPPLNLLQPTASVTPLPSAWSQLRAVAVLLGLLALTPLALSGVNTIRYNRAARAVDAQAEARAREALPRAVPVVDADAQLRARIARLSATDGFANFAAGLFTALEKAPGMELDALTYGPGQPLRATVRYRQPGDFDAFRAAAQQAGFVVESGGASNVGDRIVSAVSIRSAA